MSLTVIALVFATLCQDYVGRLSFRNAIPAITGLRAPSLVWHALQFGALRRTLQARTQQNFPADLRLEPEIRDILGQEPVATLSMWYSNTSVDGLNLVLYPVIQRYSAYTPYLDQLNANWIRDQGPRFLIFDGRAIDGRHPWTETPAMWLEIYRWYDTRLLGPRNLLLERRAKSRFTDFQSLERSRVRFGDEIRFPGSAQPIFWTMRCSLTTSGNLRAFLFRVIDVMMTVEQTSGRKDKFRVLPAVLGSPSMGNYLPTDLKEFAAVLSPDESPSFSVRTLAFDGPGSSAYGPGCEVELLRPSL